ncbi:MAG: hypothetical protein M3133_11015, partial [Actinomycetota bacterium]|nr:hypothetical protein [Actinomycetota bacterium]
AGGCCPRRLRSRGPAGVVRDGGEVTGRADGTTPITTAAQGPIGLVAELALDGPPGSVARRALASPSTL